MKKTKSTHQTNLDNMKLLVTDGQFLSVVEEVRKKLKIDPYRFSEDNKAVASWTKRLLEKGDKILDSKEFIAKEEAIKKEARENKLSYKEFAKKIMALREQVPINYLSNRINFILDKFNLPLHYNDAVKRYIMFEEITAPRQNFTIGEFPPNTKLSEAKYIPLKIYTRLTNAEIDDLKKEIKFFEKNLAKYNPLKNIDRDLEVEEWYVQNRERVDTVENTTYRMTDVEIAQNLLGSSKKGKQVYDIAKSLKRMRKGRFNSSEKT